MNSAIQTLIGKLFHIFNAILPNLTNFHHKCNFQCKRSLSDHKLQLRHTNNFSFLLLRNFPSGRSVFRRAMNIAGDFRPFSNRTRYSVFDRRKEIKMKQKPYSSSGKRSVPYVRLIYLDSSKYEILCAFITFISSPWQNLSFYTFLQLA